MGSPALTMVLLRQVFDSYDEDGDGEQQLWEVNSMLQAVVPAASSREKRMLLAQVTRGRLSRDPETISISSSGNPAALLLLLPFRP